MADGIHGAGRIGSTSMRETFVREGSRLRNRFNSFYLVVLGQAVCVGVGLWLQHHMLRSSLRDAAEQQVWAELEAEATRLNAIPGLADGLRASAEAGPDTAPHTLRPARSIVPGGVVLVDELWRPTLHWSAESGLRAASNDTAPLLWQPTDEDARAATPVRRGVLRMADGLHLAAAVPCGTAPGYVVVYQSAARADATATPLIRDLPAVGLVTFLWTVALLSITVFLITARHRDALHQQQSRSTSDAIRQTQALIRTRDAIIFALVKLAGSRDHETGGHLERMSDYCVLLGRELQQHPRYAARVNAGFVRLIGLSCILHDIGKVGIEDSVLRKPGPLTPDERQQMQQHAAIGGRCLGEIAQRLGNSNFLEMAREIALAHHEHWDGSGYPNGLRGEQIPLAARIVAIADVYDALATPRVYKQPVPHDECVAAIRALAGQQFDPDLIEAWLRVAPQFREIAAPALAQAAHGHFQADPPEQRPAAVALAADREEPALTAAPDDVHFGPEDEPCRE